MELSDGSLTRPGLSMKDPVLCRKQIGEVECITQDSFAKREAHGRSENGTVKHEGVKFAVLAAGIDSVWKVVQKALIDHPPGKGAIELCRIDADHDRLEIARDEFANQLRSVSSPDGIEAA